MYQFREDYSLIQNRCFAVARLALQYCPLAGACVRFLVVFGHLIAFLMEV